jgi:hypothetical protein
MSAHVARLSSHAGSDGVAAGQSEQAAAISIDGVHPDQPRGLNVRGKTTGVARSFSR